MILFDKLSYSSPVRQTSPALKSLFAVGSLVICVSFRQVSVCMLVLCCMAACTLQFANVTPRRYLRFLLGPLVFLALSSVAVLFFVSSSPQELFSFRLLYWYQPPFLFQLVLADGGGIFWCLLSVFSHPDHAGHRPAGCAAAAALPVAAAGADAFDLPRYLCAAGHCKRHPDCAKLPTGQSHLPLQAQLYGTDALGPVGTLAQKVLAIV